MTMRQMAAPANPAPTEASVPLKEAGRSTAVGSAAGRRPRRAACGPMVPGCSLVEGHAEPGIGGCLGCERRLVLGLAGDQSRAAAHNDDGSGDGRSRANRERDRADGRNGGKRSGRCAHRLVTS